MSLRKGFRRLLGGGLRSRDSPDESSTPYTYEKLPDASTHIRLATWLPSPDSDAQIHFTLQTVLLADAPRYLALSYACGDPTDTRAILLHGIPVQVYRNLESALRHMRPVLTSSDKTTTPLWIDAICIDQSDGEEKSIQVRNMASIYKKASASLAWLGEAADDSERTLNMLKRLGDTGWKIAWKSLQARWPTLSINERRQELQTMKDLLNLSTDISSTKSLSDFAWYIRLQPSPPEGGRTSDDLKLAAVLGRRALRGLGRVILRDFFRRLWIYQEYLLAQEVFFICGTQFVSGSALEAAFSLMVYDDSCVERLELTIARERAAITLSVTQILSLVAARGNTYVNPALAAGRPLLDLMYSYGDGICSDPRDKIYALLGLATDRLASRVKPDYSQPTAYVYMKLVETWVDVYQDLYILNCCNYSQVYPSWVPDFEGRLWPMMQGSRQSFYSAHGTSKAIYERATGHRGRELLLLQGMTVDHVSKLGDPILDEPTLQDPVLLQWRDLAALTTLPPIAFWTSLTLELDESGNRMSADRLQAIHDFLNDCDCFEEPQTDRSARVFARLERVLARRFFVTRQGRIGLAKMDVQVDDQVCVLLGGQTPFILRPAGHGEHTLCSDAYVYGIMDGEAMVDYEAGKYAKQQYRIC